MGDNYIINEAKASDVKGNSIVANMARDYLKKYPTFFTFRVNEHIKLLEKTLGNKQKDVVKVIVGVLREMVNDMRVGTGTTVIAFTEDKVYAVQKGLIFKENIKILNRERIDDVSITTGMIYAQFNLEDLHVGMIHKKAVPELKEFFEEYIDSKVDVKKDSKVDKQAKEMVVENFIAKRYADGIINEELFKVEVEDLDNGGTRTKEIDAPTENEAITKAIGALNVDVENIRSVERINEALVMPKKKEKQNDFVSRFMSSKQSKVDFPDHKQRVAVAFSQWERSKKK
jgi:hypothetical protein